jgi:hypothetical protein
MVASVERRARRVYAAGARSSMRAALRRRTDGMRGVSSMATATPIAGAHQECDWRCKRDDPRPRNDAVRATNAVLESM